MTEATSLSQQPKVLLYALFVICLGSLLGPLDTSVNVAFPLITRTFGLAISDIQWIIASFIIAQSGLTLAFGQLGDLYGHRRVFRWGLAACAITHLLCSLAPSFPFLVVGRVAQGVATGLAMACGPALATLLFPPALRRTILSIYVMLLGAGIALGPLIGGLLLDWGGWPTVFWFRTPLALAALILSIWLPEPKIERPLKPRFDYLGALFLTCSLASLVLLINMARRNDASVWSVLVFALVLAGFVWSFVRHESGFPQPILHIRYLRNSTFGKLQLASVLINLCGFSIFLLLPYCLDTHFRASSLTIGLMLAVSPIGAVTVGLVSARMGGQWPARRLLLTGCLAAAVGLFCVGVLIPLQALSPLALALFCTGVGIGLFQIGFMDITTATLPPSERGVAGSLLNVTRVVGAVIGGASITWLLDGWRGMHSGAAAFAWTFATLGLVLAACALGHWLLSRLLSGRALSKD
jgi:MFS family permease